jgi:lycopene beta-cyclase
MPHRQYDLIIAGMGCAGLSLAVRLSREGLTRGKRILLVDRERKDANNRTWCYWETEAGPFDDIVFRKWDHAWFHSTGFSSRLELAPYTYKMIRGIDFYNHCMEVIRSDESFEVRHEEVEAVTTRNGEGVCRTRDNVYTAPVVFNSILFTKPPLRNGEFYLLQHFKGWVIRTAKPFFDPSTATLMDFRPDQGHGTTFVYVMPFSETEALVEYTLFTESLLADQDYDKGLTQYLQQQLGLKQWDVVEQEFGIIPMTNYHFPRRQDAVINIGTAGGMTKASSGFTFRFIQKDTEQIVRAMKKSGSPDVTVCGQGRRFRWYDSVLLHILSNRVLPGDSIFANLFRNNEPHHILRFLDNETSVPEELRIMWSLPQWPFMKAGIREGLLSIR